MDQMMVQLDAPVAAPDGGAYVARAWGREMDDGRWTAWIEFEPRDSGPALRAPAEAELASRDDFEAWVAGLQGADLEPVLERAHQRHRAGERTGAPEAADAGGAGSGSGEADGAHRARPRTGLDPFAAYDQGTEVLRDWLDAANERQLRAVIRGHHWVDERSIDLDRISHVVLEEMIVAAVRRQAADRGMERQH